MLYCSIFLACVCANVFAHRAVDFASFVACAHVCIVEIEISQERLGISNPRKTDPVE